MCIISTAQQARPNVRGQIEPFFQKKRASFQKSTIIWVSYMTGYSSGKVEKIVEAGQGVISFVVLEGNLKRREFVWLDSSYIA